MAIKGDASRYDEKFLQNYADINIIPAIKRVSGVGGCEVMGAKTYSMRIWLDPVKMKNYGLMRLTYRMCWLSRILRPHQVSLVSRATTSMNTQYVIRDVCRLLLNLKI